MNRIIKISCLIFYLAFALIYPIVHVHAQEHHDVIEIQLSVHPPEIASTDHDHSHSDNHDHEDKHFEGDLDYTFQGTAVSFKISERPIFYNETSDDEPKELNRIIQDILLKHPPDFLFLDLSDRAPPHLI